MQAACGKMPGADIREDDEPPPAWYDAPPTAALPKAGEEYLRHVLSHDQLALYRVVTRDAHRFPELSRRYHEETAGTPSSPAISIFGQSARAGGCATSTPQPRCLPDC
jgi:hypothetical protein